MRKFSVRIFDEKKGWPQRGHRFVCWTAQEAIAMAKAKKGLAPDARVLVAYRVVG